MTLNPKDRPRLGRGINSLLSPTAAPPAAPAPEADTTLPHARVLEIPVDQVRPNPHQPRREFNEAALAALAESMKAAGVIQPIIVRQAPDGYELIAGERRLRAATRLGWKEIPALVRDIDERTLLTLALVENLQRADLNAIEEAEGYQQLITEFGLTQQEVADAVGKDRSTVANLLRLLALPASVRRLIQDGKLSAGHGRALLALPNERAIQELARHAAEEQLSVREVERRVRDATSPAKPEKPNATGPDRRPAEVRRLEAELRRYLQTDVQIALSGAEKGRIILNFYSAEDFERIVELVLGAEAH